MKLRTPSRVASRSRERKLLIRRTGLVRGVPPGVCGALVLPGVVGDAGMETGGGIDGERTRSVLGETARSRSLSLAPVPERLRPPPTRHTSAVRASPSCIAIACAVGGTRAPGVEEKKASK